MLLAVRCSVCADGFSREQLITEVPLSSRGGWAASAVCTQSCCGGGGGVAGWLHFTLH